VPVLLGKYGDVTFVSCEKYGDVRPVLLCLASLSVEACDEYFEGGADFVSTGSSSELNVKCERGTCSNFL